jgi:uncharacterized protein (TIGR02453 family)
MFTGFTQDGIAFLSGLAQNNRKDWFEANRRRYEAGLLEPGKAFVAALGPRLQAAVPTMRAEPKIGGSIFRINRDIRFSNDKSPYKTHFDLWFWDDSAGACEKGWESSGLWMRLGGDGWMLGVGMHEFTKEKLARYRNAVAKDTAGLVAALGGETPGGRTYKRPPPGFTSSRPELLLHSGLWLSTEGPVPASAFTAGLVEEVATFFTRRVAFHRWLQEV